MHKYFRNISRIHTGMELMSRSLDDVSILWGPYTISHVCACVRIKGIRVRVLLATDDTATNDAIGCGCRAVVMNNNTMREDGKNTATTSIN